MNAQLHDLKAVDTVLKNQKKLKVSCVFLSSIFLLSPILPVFIFDWNLSFVFQIKTKSRNNECKYRLFKSVIQMRIEVYKIGVLFQKCL